MIEIKKLINKVIFNPQLYSKINSVFEIMVVVTIQSVFCLKLFLTSIHQNNLKLYNFFTSNKKIKI
jgi:hypothetical protein